ncbi:hypothetical protein BD414DRAFT_502613 [Trametes punicea]|nr:hypothetical protein BD414DRAFT_502613 [Trametes punicea]
MCICASVLQWSCHVSSTVCVFAGTSGWARRNNLDKHIRSVHQGMRPFVCPAGGCARAFSRKHDMQRHFQSNHTNMGSPRRKAASK